MGFCNVTVPFDIVIGCIPIESSEVSFPANREASIAHYLNEFYIWESLASKEVRFINVKFN